VQIKISDNRIDFGQESKISSKIEILVKNRKFGQKLKFCSEIENLFKNSNRNLGQTSKFQLKSKIWSNIEMFVEQKIEKSKFWSKIEILVKHRNFGPKSKFWLKIESLIQNQNFD